MAYRSKNPNETNCGDVWSPELQAELITLISTDMSVEEIALHFKRSVNGIATRKHHIARRLIEEGKSIEYVSDILKISVSSIYKSLASFKLKTQNAQKRRDAKKETKLLAKIPTINEETSLDVLKDIRSLLQQMVKP